MSHPFAAQVVLAGAPDTPIDATTARVRSFEPSSEQVERAVRAFEALGFRTGPVVGNSFSIEGDEKQFHQTFGLSLGVDKTGTVINKGARGERILTLPLNRLPHSLELQLKAVVFAEPPAFGPGAP